VQPQGKEYRSELRGKSMSEVVTLVSYSLEAGSSTAICVLWKSKPLWLPGNRMKLVHLSDGKATLRIPKELPEFRQMRQRRRLGSTQCERE